MSWLSDQQLKDIAAGSPPAASALDDKSAEFSELDYATLLEWNSYFQSWHSPEEKEYLAREFWGGRWSRWFKNMCIREY